MSAMPDPRSFDECAYEGWDYAEAEAWYELQVARELAAGGRTTGADVATGEKRSGEMSSTGDGPFAPAASFQCTPCPCGGLCDNCEEAE